MKTIHQGILSKIEKSPKGKVLFLSDFRGLGPESAIKMALSRLARQGHIQRLSQGIYLNPERDPVMGDIYPSLEKIAESIAKKERIRIRPAGAYALNKLGLSSQVPMRLVYMTNGARKYIRIGKGGIKFKPTSPKKLSLKGKISSLVIEALEELGREGITPEVKNKIFTLLQKEKAQYLMHDLRISPGWIHDLIYSLMIENK
jgi:hypothetical protein